MNLSQRWSMLRFYSLGFCSLALCGFWLAAGEASAQERVEELRSGEAFVAVKVTGDIKSITFQRFQGEESFVAERHTDGRLIRVKPGRYYVKTVTPVHMGIRLRTSPEPAEPSQTVAIREGMLNYIGDWKFIEKPTEIDYDIERRFDLETVRTIVRKHNIPKYTLMVSKVGELPVKTAMP